jgi:hypothetical protein
MRDVTIAVLSCLLIFAVGSCQHFEVDREALDQAVRSARMQGAVDASNQAWKDCRYHYNIKDE